MLLASAFEVVHEVGVGVHLQAFNKAGVPKGVINIVTGRGSEIGDYLTVRPSWVP
jgi:acyl-CoA reductase-like NAD-dependent aldehyde dehydrogenase